MPGVCRLVGGDGLAAIEGEWPGIGLGAGGWLLLLLLRVLLLLLLLGLHEASQGKPSGLQPPTDGVASSEGHDGDGDCGDCGEVCV